MRYRQRIAQLVFSFFFIPFGILFFGKAKALKLGFVLLLLISLSGCFKNYLKTRTFNFSDSTINALNQPEKNIILFTKNNFFQLTHIAVNGEQIEAEIKQIPITDRSLIYKIESRDVAYKHRNKDYLFSQIHLFTDLPDPLDSTHIVFPIKSVSKVEVYQKDGGKTTLSYILGGLAVYAGLGLVLFTIILISCNCPQVYVYDGQQYNFKSGVFSGAIYSSLERTDFLPLEGVQPYNGKFRFQLANNQKEEQYVNQVELIQVSHAPDTKVLLDRFGKPHTYSNAPSLPIGTLASNNLLETIAYSDGNSYLFSKSMDQQSVNGNIVLDFDNKNNSTTAKLIVHAKNSLWSGYIFNEFSAMFGSNYQKWIAKKDHSRQEDLEKWQLDQSLPLMVYLQTNKGWKFVDYFPFTGNTAGRDMVMSIPVDSTSKIVKIKIESAFMFWDLDYAAVDFDADKAMNLSFIRPSLASFRGSDSKINELLQKDDSYALMKEDEFLQLEFNSNPVAAGSINSIFLSTTGYYHSTKNYPGKTQIVTLYRFKKKGAFNEFSKATFKAQSALLAKGIQLPTMQQTE